MPPLISICLPNLNTRPFLEERMETLLAQTFTDWELIISDNYSDDGSWEFVQKFKNDPRVHLFQTPRMGMYANWNECVRCAQGRYVYIATSDDTARPELLERLAAPLERRPDLHLAMCDFDAIDEAGRAQDPPLQQWQIAFYKEWMTMPSIRNGRTEVLMHACFGPTWHTMTSVLIRRSLLERTGLFRTDCGSIADYDWDLRASLATDIAFVPGRLATWRVREGQATVRVFGPEFNRDMLAMLECVLHDPHAGVPEHWKRVPDWIGEITDARRKMYLNSFRLWRRAMWETPSAVAGRFQKALRLEPGLLMRQVGRAFAWSESFRVDPVKRAAELIRMFDAPWPPRPLSA